MKKNSPFPPSGTIPKWYKHQLEFTAIYPNSIRLKDIYKNLCPSEPKSDGFSFYTALNHAYPTARSTRLGYWCGFLNPIDNSPFIGRVVKNSSHHLWIQHWIKVPNPLSTLTPSSQPFSVQECPGCVFHDLNASSINAAGRVTQHSYLEKFPCLFTQAHDTIFDLRSLPIQLPRYNLQDQIFTFKYLGTCFHKFSHIINRLLN